MVVWECCVIWKSHAVSSCTRGWRSPSIPCALDWIGGVCVCVCLCAERQRFLTSGEAISTTTRSVISSKPHLQRAVLWCTWTHASLLSSDGLSRQPRKLYQLSPTSKTKIFGVILYHLPIVSSMISSVFASMISLVFCWWSLLYNFNCAC